MQNQSWKTVATTVTLAALVSRAVEQPREGDSQPEEVVVRVAAISFVPEKFNLAATSDRLKQALREVKQGGGQLAVAPGERCKAILSASIKKVQIR